MLERLLELHDIAKEVTLSSSWYPADELVLLPYQPVAKVSGFGLASSADRRQTTALRRIREATAVLVCLSRLLENSTCNKLTLAPFLHDLTRDIRD